MSEYTLYSDVLTEAEAALGFELVEAKNPLGEFAFQPKTVRAVVRWLNSTDRLIKFDSPFGPPTYHHQRYGVWGGQDISRADWKPVSSIAYPKAELAVHAVTQSLEARLQELLDFDPQVIPVEPGDNH